MAIFKHVPSHNVNYQGAVNYLTQEHDEESGKPVLDADGFPVERKSFLLEGINCTPENWAQYCYHDARTYGKNKLREEVKTHQYILSFAPGDREQGLTMEECQALGLSYCKKYFGGHRALVCTHPDGINGAGNIHCHIIICSVRFEDREMDEEYMRTSKSKTRTGCVLPGEYRAGYKHQDSGKLRRYVNARLQEYCRERGYDSRPNGQERGKKVTEREYKARQKGQKKLDERNRRKRERGEPVWRETYDTWKDELRRAIDESLVCCSSVTELKKHLQENTTYVVIVTGEDGTIKKKRATVPFDVKFSRGRLSFYHPGVKKWIRGKSLGAQYEEKSVAESLSQQQKRMKEQRLSQSSRSKADER